MSQFASTLYPQTNPTDGVAARCLCGGCDAACQHRPFKPCCGACMDDTPHRQAVIVWPLSG